MRSFYKDSMLNQGRRRQIYRIPVSPSLKIQVIVVLPNHTVWVAKCLNISFNGTLLAFPVKATPDVSANSKVLVKFLFQNKVTCLPGIVKSLQNRQMGVFFPSGEGDRSKDDEDHFCQMIRAIEREALKARAMNSPRQPLS